MSTKSVHDQILESYLGPIEASFQENPPQLKLINYGTGSGKTYQLFKAIYQTIEQHRDSQIIGIYIAPLREHLSVPGSLERDYPDTPVYKLNSLEMKTTDELLELYKKWIPSILKNTDLWKIAAEAARKIDSRKKKKDKKTDEKADKKAKANLQTVEGVINRLEYIKRIEFGDKDFNQSETTKAKRELNNLLESFLKFFINCKLDQTNWPNECLKLMEIFFPLHLLREKSGILMLTYKKFETNIPYFKLKDEIWVKQEEHLDKYAIAPENNSKKFIFALDEQEDGYQIMLKEKIDIISPEDMAINNALSSIKREFSLLFSTQNQQNRKLLRELLDFLHQNKGAYEEFQEIFEKGKSIDRALVRYAPIYQQLTSEEGNSREFLKEVISIYKGMDNSLQEIVSLFQNFHKENPIELDWEVLWRVLSKFENNRSLLISHELYNKYQDDLMNIFCYNDLYVYNIEHLKELFLIKPSGGHVRITEEKEDKEKKVSEGTSVAELIYTILAMRSQIKKIKDLLVDVLDAKDSQSRSLDIWSQQIDKVDKVKKANEESRKENPQLKYFNDTYVYESNKSRVNIKEISRYQQKKLIDPALTEVSIGNTVIFTSPEHKIHSILANKAKANVLFLISATGGISGDLSTSYDFRYFKDKLRSPSGESNFQPMTEEEVSLCEQIRESRQSKSNRNITVNFFNQDLSSFPNGETQEVVTRFEESILEDFIDQKKNSGLHRYKIQELNSFIRFLFYLWEDDKIQETIAFTQTLSWIKQLLEYWERCHSGNFKLSQNKNPEENQVEHPSIYYLHGVNYKKYQSKIKIKIILYYADFNKDYNDKTTEKSYLKELVEEEGQKIFFISAYASASKGLNPIVKNPDGEEKDFDSLILLTDSYYTMMSSKPKKKKKKDDLAKKSEDEEKSTTLQHFALMKNIVHVGESKAIKEFNQYLSEPDAARFKAQQHQILLGKAIVQAIGRSERRDFPNQVSKIFLNEETRNNLVNFYNYLQRQREEDEEYNEIGKLSMNNYQVYLRVTEEEEKRCINDYEEHVKNEIYAASKFREHQKKMLKEIELFKQNKNTIDITTAWEALRNPIAFQDPAQYLEKLQQSKLFPDDFIESLFYDKSEQPEFTPYLAWEDDGEKIWIISDRIKGEKIYLYQQRLYPEYLKTNGGGYDREGDEIGWLNDSTRQIYKLYRELIPDPEIFNRYIPRPHFFYDIFYPSLTENFVARWIKDVIFPGKDWDAIKTFYGLEQLSDFQKYNKLYELFDLYYLKNHTLLCIDVKAWSKGSGNRLSPKTVKKTKAKLKTIVSDYTEFATVRGLLLNLHGKEKNRDLAPNLSSGNLIYFDDSNCPVASDILKKFLGLKK